MDTGVATENDRYFVRRTFLIASSREKGEQDLLISHLNSGLFNSKYVRDFYLCGNGRFCI